MEILTQTKPVIIGAIGGAIAVAIIGFTWGGWMTTGNAMKMAKKESDTAVVSVLAPICVEKFQQQTDAVANLVALKETNSYKQAAFITDGGWATMSGADTPYSGTAKACADMLSKLP